MTGAVVWVAVRAAWGVCGRSYRLRPPITLRAAGTGRPFLTGAATHGPEVDIEGAGLPARGGGSGSWFKASRRAVAASRVRASTPPRIGAGA